MFHLAIVFMPVLLLGLGIAIIATLLTGLGLLLAALAGGASVALLVQDKSLKRLLLLGCGILALVGITCVSLVLSWSYWVTVSCCAAVIVLSILGLCGSKCIANKYGRVGSIMLFAFAAAAALLFGIIVVAMGIG